MLKLHLKMVYLMMTFRLLVRALQANDSNTTLYMLQLIFGFS